MSIELASDDVVVHIASPQMVTTPDGASGGGSGRGGGGGGSALGRRLLVAARAGDTDAVLELMGKGAPFTTDWLGTSALHLAAAGAHADTCAVLVRAGVSRDARTKVDRTPLHVAAAAGHSRIAALLLDHGAEVDCRDMLRMTPLHWAMVRGHADTAALLLRRGADPDARSKFRQTPRALAERYPELAAVLEDALRDRAADAADRAIAATAAAAAAADAPEHAAAAAAASASALEQIVKKPEEASIIFKNIKDITEDTSLRKLKRPITIKALTTEQQKALNERSQIVSGAGDGVGGDEGEAETAGARLLRRHGITLLPAEPGGGTVLNALQSGRTVVLSDAGKLMLKESSDGRDRNAPNIIRGQTGAPGQGVVLTATPVRVPPRPGVKVFTLNNKLVAISKSNNKIPVKRVGGPQDVKVKYVKVPVESEPPAARSAGSVGGPGGAVRIVMNRANFDKLVAGARGEAREEAPVESDGTAQLREELAQARSEAAGLRARLEDCRRRLRRYERAALPGAD